MTVKKYSYFAIAAIVIAFQSGHIVSAQEAGRNEAVLLQALAAAARGECPATILAPSLRGICLQQMPGMGQRLAGMGSITKIDFLGTQQIQSFPVVEVYLVRYENGSLTWLATTGPDGKLSVMWSGG